MKLILTLSLMSLLASPLIIFDFVKDGSIKNWTIVDDVVMGGRSNGKFSLNKEGHGVFEGQVSLDNNGGFSSLRYRNSVVNRKGYKNVALTIKGDGKKYQFRVKANTSDYYSFIYTFETTGKWQTITIPLNQMYPSFRGRKLDQPNFSANTISEVTFLIANKKNERFQLLIDKIELSN